jgi:capsular exopolysaccharide synthesis family protein
MERIKQALEKARADRMQAGGPVMPLAARGAPSPVDEIHYSQTRAIAVPYETLREQRIVAADSARPFADSYKILRTQVLQRMTENGWKSLAITSAGPSEGKTLTAINLGIGLANEVTHTVLLVDADLRAPAVHRHFGLEPQPGLSEYLTENVPLTDLLINPAGIARFVVLPGGRPLANSAEMLNSPRMTRLVEELESRYRSRIILFDLPPVLESADTLSFSPQVDAALLVVEEGKTTVDDAQRAIELLRKTRLIGTVLNKARKLTVEATETANLSDRLFDTLEHSRRLNRAFKALRGMKNSLRGWWRRVRGRGS